MISSVQVLHSKEPPQHSLLDTGKPRKTCADVAGHRTFRILTSGHQSGNYISTTHTVKQYMSGNKNTRKIITQYTKINCSYTYENQHKGKKVLYLDSNTVTPQVLHTNFNMTFTSLHHP
jgi:hypothetical protein